jgi:polyisoprenoid-binding protein YceI
MMKNSFVLAMSKTLLILGIVSLPVLPILAQGGTWKVDAEHSTAAIFIGSNLDLQNVGIARIGGMADFDSSAPAKSDLDISADLPEGQAITFKSKRIELRADGKLQITGDLTLAQTKFDATLNPGEDYRGPINGESAVRTVTRSVSFLMPLPASTERAAEIDAEAILGIENFPELLAAVSHAAWQPVIQDEACGMPPAGEDYSGPLCKGKLIVPAVQVASITAGEDYRGNESPAPSGKVMKIVLRLQVNRQDLG